MRAVLLFAVAAPALAFADAAVPGEPVAEGRIAPSAELSAERACPRPAGAPR